MALNEYRPGTAFPEVIGRAFDQSSPAWPQPLRALLATLLAGSAAAETIPIAVVASVIGWLVATALQREPPDTSPVQHRPADGPRLR
jgi:hypothetical protein